MASSLNAVFLSFRGPDIRNGFTSLLYDALQRPGIRTFIDDEELRGGSEISLNCVTLFVVLKCLSLCSPKTMLLPDGVWTSWWRSLSAGELRDFYDVEPYVVRHQRESYALAFEKYCSKDDFDQQRVKRWRDALKEAAHLSGRVLKHEEDGNEAKLIKKIVENVGQIVGNIGCLNVAENLVGIESQVERIKELLNISSVGVRIIGIFGMGGVGKTTVSKAVYNSYTHLNHFDSIAFVENIKEFSKIADGLLHLQERLLSQLGRKDIKLSNSDDGINKKKILILLDDLDDFEQIQSLAGNKTWFGVVSSKRG